MPPTEPERYRPVALPPAYQRVIGSASRLVPYLRRASWRREWQAELAYAFSTTASKSGRGKRRLLMRALWSHVDALWVWKEEITMTRLLADLRLAVRSLRRAPMFTAVSVLTLALGIGANAAIFSVVNSVLIKPLPYPESERIVTVLFEAPGLGLPMIPFSEGVYLFVRDNQHAYEAVGMYNTERVNLVGDGDPEQVDGARITPSVLDVLRVIPALGRPFGPQDAVPGADPVAMLSHDLWNRRYGAEPGIVGSTLELDGVMRRVVGIMPADFSWFDENPAVWRPFVIDPADAPVSSFSYPGIARLADGETLQSAHDDMVSLVGRLGEQFPDDLPAGMLEQARFAPQLSSLRAILVGDIQRSLWVVLGTVALVLVIACANVANLFLVRAETRQREVTLRAALGAGRADLVRFYLTESVLLGLAGGLAGLVMAWAGLRAFVASAPSAIPRVEEIGIDGAGLVLTLALSVFAGVVFGAIPMLRSGGRDLAGKLREGGRSTTAGGGAVSTRNVLVVAQVALALVLLVGSGLMIRSFTALRNVDPGFRAENVLTVGVAPPSAEYPGPEERSAFWDQLFDRLSVIPGVVASAGITGVPLGGNKSAGGAYIEGQMPGEDEIPPIAEKRQVTPGYFSTMGISLLEGREFTDADGADGFPAAVVSASFARRHWPGENALGHRLSEGRDDPTWFEVVGVAADVHFETLDKPAEEAIYFPTRNGPPDDLDVPGSMDLVLRTTSDPGKLADAVRAAVWEVDARLPIANMQPLARVLRNSVSRTSFTLAMLGIAAGVALLLGAIGIYGVISYLVSQRTQEIGLRIALGAPAASVRRMVVRRGMTLTVIGIGIGLAAAVGVSSVLAALLFEVSATDPVTYVGVTLVLVLTALVASWLPALRASNVDPVIALRAE